MYRFACKPSTKLDPHTGEGAPFPLPPRFFRPTPLLPKKAKQKWIGATVLNMPFVADETKSPRCSRGCIWLRSASLPAGNCRIRCDVSICVCDLTARCVSQLMSRDKAGHFRPVWPDDWRSRGPADVWRFDDEWGHDDVTSFVTSHVTSFVTSTCMTLSLGVPQLPAHPSLPSIDYVLVLVILPMQWMVCRIFCCLLEICIGPVPMR